MDGRADLVQVPGHELGRAPIEVVDELEIVLEQAGRAAFAPFGVEPEYFAGVDPVSLRPIDWRTTAALASNHSSSCATTRCSNP